MGHHRSLWPLPRVCRRRYILFANAALCATAETYPGAITPSFFCGFLVLSSTGRQQSSILSFPDCPIGLKSTTGREREPPPPSIRPSLQRPLVSLYRDLSPGGMHVARRSVGASVSVLPAFVPHRVARCLAFDNEQRAGAPRSSQVHPLTDHHNGGIIIAVHGGAESPRQRLQRR